MKNSTGLWVVTHIERNPLNHEGQLRVKVQQFIGGEEYFSKDHVWAEAPYGSALVCGDFVRLVRDDVGLHLKPPSVEWHKENGLWNSMSKDDQAAVQRGEIPHVIPNELDLPFADTITHAHRP